MTARFPRHPLLAASLVLIAGCHTPTREETAAPTPHPMALAEGATLADAVIDAGCGQCQFGLPGAGCQLAVRMDGKAAFVDGTGIDDHGDAHAADGMCNAVRQARVTGRVVNGRFRASAFELLRSGS